MNRITTTKPSVSFEFFPPHSEQAEATLWRSIERLKRIADHVHEWLFGLDIVEDEKDLSLKK